MKGNIIFICMMLTLILTGSPAIGEDSDPQLYCGQQIEKRIDSCERKALLVNSGSERVRLQAELARKQSHYYTGNKDRLVQEMAQEHLKCSEHKVNAFLIEAFNAENEDMGVLYTEK
jgi:hypothetical protein